MAPEATPAGAFLYIEGAGLYLNAGGGSPAGHGTLVGRYEYADDTDGGFMTFGTKVQSVTVTSDHLVAGALRLRLEYRTDFADDAVFPDDDGGFKDSQTTFTVGLVYSFGGKI